MIVDMDTAVSKMCDATFFIRKLIIEGLKLKKAY